MLLIGDSVMLQAKPALEQAIPGAHVDAGVSRQLGDAVAALEAVKQQGELPPTIVIHLGDNGPSEGDVFEKVTTEFKSIMDTVGSESQVYFLTLKLPRLWEATVNTALYSEVAVFPNAHVLAWHDVAQSHGDWFLVDSFHLSAAGKTAYAAFIRDGIRNPVSTFSDPFAAGAIPPSGFVVTDDPKAAPDRQGTSFTMEVFDATGKDLGPLPRATISNDSLNAPRHVLIATDDAVRLEPLPLEAPGDVPGGCTRTETDEALAVALCGSDSGYNVLGDRILVNNGTGWSQLIGLPPVAAGSDPPVGHWAWASPSPDGRWVAAGWSSECEVPKAFLVSVADGSMHTVTGEVRQEWRIAPESGFIGWSADGSAMGVFGGDSACGTPASVPRGIYLVAPDTGSRRLLLVLTPSQSVLTWNAVDDKRNP